MESKFVSDVRHSVEAASASGLYCAEIVLLALAKAQGVDSEWLPKVATAFCSGMSRTGGHCGALTGAVMGVSLAFGRNKPGEPMSELYAATQQLVREFEQEFGARNCSDLLDCDLATSQGRIKFCEERLHERCAKYTSGAAEIAARVIAERKG